MIEATALGKAPSGDIEPKISSTVVTPSTTPPTTSSQNGSIKPASIGVNPSKTNSPVIPNPLTYRPIVPTDSQALRKMRRVCGWGEARVPTYLEPDSGYDIYLFSTEIDEEDGAMEEVIGMGGIRYKSDEEGVASEEEGLVQITSLFIYPSFQALGLGRHMMSILETICRERYKARQISVMTTAYDNVYAKETGGEYGKVAKWYMRLGYKPWREPQLLPFPGDKTGERSHYAVYLKRTFD